MHFPPRLHPAIFKHNPLLEGNESLEAGKGRWPGGHSGQMKEAGGKTHHLQPMPTAWDVVN